MKSKRLQCAGVSGAHASGNQLAAIETHLRKPLAVLTRRHAGMAFEQIAEKPDVFVPDFGADSLDRRSAGFEQFLGCRNPECLDVGARHTPGRGLEAANEIARTHSGSLGEVANRDIAVKMLLQIFFRLADF